MTGTKLHIEMDGNVLDVEGDSALVERVYNDFKDQIAAAEPDGIQAPTAGPQAENREFFLSGTQRDTSLRQDIAPLVAMTHTPEIEKRLARELKGSIN